MHHSTPTHWLHDFHGHLTVRWLRSIRKFMKIQWAANASVTVSLEHFLSRAFCPAQLVLTGAPRVRWPYTWLFLPRQFLLFPRWGFINGHWINWLPLPWVRTLPGSHKLGHQEASHPMSVASHPHPMTWLVLSRWVWWKRRWNCPIWWTWTQQAACTGSTKSCWKPCRAKMSSSASWRHSWRSRWVLAPFAAAGAAARGPWAEPLCFGLWWQGLHSLTRLFIRMEM